MEAIIGLVLGIIATVLVSRYYFLRSVDKSLSVFKLLNSYVFAGIAQDVRRDLHFIFKEQEVDELQQIVLLIANDGERAISNIIEPLSAQLPSQVEVLDVSILYRSPASLKARINQQSGPDGQTIAFAFPLLNKGEFFVVKLLLSGNIEIHDLPFSVLADDLPRLLKIKPLPPASIRDSGYKVDWSLVGVSSFFLLFPIWILYLLHTVWLKQPQIFPYPWNDYVFSWSSFLLLFPASLLVLFFGALGITMAISAFFDGEFPPKRGPKFPLPKELRSLAFPYRLSFPAAFDESILNKVPPPKSDSSSREADSPQARVGWADKPSKNSTRALGFAAQPTTAVIDTICTHYEA